jgi:hypothetical protein
MRGYRVADSRLTEFTTSNVIFDADGQRGRGPIPVVSANGNSDAIVWTVQRRVSDSHQLLRAFDANDLQRELYNTEQNAARDALPNGGTVFMVPLVINGRVYVTAGNRLHVYGLLP